MRSERLVDGVVPDHVATPTSDEEIAAILADGMSEDDWILPIGGGTALSSGNAVDRVPLLLETRGINGVTEYEPADLTISVRAGTRWSELQSTLAEHGQTVPLDVPFVEAATVGGVAASGWAGPRRLRDGSMKDLIIGASFVWGEGLVAKAGGMVVKNVSGFEISRLLHGSQGALAVITSVNLKVVPRHDAEITLHSDRLPVRDAITAGLELTRAEPTVSSCVVDGDEHTGTIAIRLSGRRKPTHELAARVRESIAASIRDEMLEDDASAHFWQSRSDQLASPFDDRTLIEVGCSPAQIGETWSDLVGAMSHVGDVRYYVSPGTGAVVVDFPSEACDFDTWNALWRDSGLRLTSRYAVTHAPRTWREGHDVWSISDNSRMMMLALKNQFDPHHRLNRGRLWDQYAMPGMRAGSMN